MIIQDIFFSEIECERIINLKKNNQQYWSNKRDYISESIFYNEESKWIFEKLESFALKHVKSYKFKKINQTIHFHTYHQGQWFGIHNDVRENRIYGVGVLLNENFEDGDFVFYDKDLITINKKIGNAYIFDVNINHEVKKIIKGIRYSLLWFLTDENLSYINKSLI